MSIEIVKSQHDARIMFSMDVILLTNLVQRQVMHVSVLGLERGPLSFVRIREELIEKKGSGSGLEN
jgi:hypothetical protein